MNFKFTKAKTIISLILGLALGIVYMYIAIPAGGCADGLCWDYGPTDQSLITGFIGATIAIYIVWSLFQRR